MANVDFVKDYARDLANHMAYDKAEAAGDEAAMERCREEWKAWSEEMTAKGQEYCKLYRLHENMFVVGNEYIDLNDCIYEKDVAGMIASFRKYGVQHFTFSSGWSSSNEIAWLFIQNGCTLEGMVELNSQHTRFLSEEHEKAHGYLFRVNS